MPIANDRDDEHWMRIAFQSAVQGQGFVEPNPMVGCVLVKDGRCIATGYHHFFGGPHAEVEALNSLASPTDAAGATAYVTLEPCCHHGKTPPCSAALINAKVARVVVAMKDPFPKVDGGGIQQLRDAGIEVTVDVLMRESESLNAAYLKRVRTGMPWVIAKWAMTIDGRIATVDRQSQWITGESSRQQVHRLRSRVDAIIVGMGTVNADDPMLNARVIGEGNKLVRPARVAKRALLCHHRLPSLDSKLMRSASEIPTWIFASAETDRSKLKTLESAGATIFPLDSSDRQAMVRQMLTRMGEHSMTNVMIEGGGEVLASFLDPSTGQCLIDECHCYLGAKLFGGQAAAGPIAGSGIGPIELAPHFELLALDRFDDDVLAIYRRRS